jgi:hypothetical protein
VSRLPDIQAAFQRFLLTGEPEIGSHVVGTQRVPIETRLGIYGGAYRSRLIEALESTFPVLAELLGEDDFHTLASTYVNTHESTFFSIRYYGDQMAGFLATDPEYAKAPLLAELAKWEWAMAEAFDAADASSIGISDFARLAPEDWAELRFEWSPSAQVLALEWNVPEIWKSVTERGDSGSDDGDVGAAASGDLQPPDPRLDAASWLIWRRDLQIYFRPLLQEEAAVIAASKAGQSFGELCVALCDHLDEAQASQQAAGFLRGWVESGLISSMSRG